MPIENSDQPGHPCKLIRGFAIHLKKLWFVGYLPMTQWRLWIRSWRLLNVHWVCKTCMWFCVLLLSSSFHLLPTIQSQLFLISLLVIEQKLHIIWAPSSEFVSSSFPSWEILTAHAKPFRGARDLAFCLKVPLDSLLVWASSEGSGETARMRRLAWTFAARIGDKYQIRLTRSI